MNKDTTDDEKKEILYKQLELHAEESKKGLVLILRY